jgi:hypothetical protein
MVVIVFFRCSFFAHFHSGKSSGAFWFVFSLHFLLSFLFDSELLPPLPKEGREIIVQTIGGKSSFKRACVARLNLIGEAQTIDR